MNLRTRVMIIGGLAGGLLGAAAAFLYLRSVSGGDTGEEIEELPKVQPSSVLTVILAVLTVLRQIAGLGQREEARQRGEPVPK